MAHARPIAVGTTHDKRARTLDRLHSMPEWWVIFTRESVECRKVQGRAAAQAAIPGSIPNDEIHCRDAETAIRVAAEQAKVRRLKLGDMSAVK